MPDDTNTIEVPKDIVAQSGATRLAKWHRRQCNGEWEHRHGIKIETTDNPGWMVVIDIEDTDAEQALVGEGKNDGMTWEVCAPDDTSQLWGYDEGTGNLDGLLSMLASILEATETNSKSAVSAT